MEAETTVVSSDEEKLISMAQSAKEDGNKCYSQGNYKEAIDLYTKALSYLAPESLLNPMKVIEEASEELPTPTQTIETQETETTQEETTDKSEKTVLETQTSKETSTHKETQETETTQEADKEPSEKNVSETQTSKEASTPPIKELIKGPFQSYCATYLANRAAAYLALEDWDNTIKDANIVLQLDPKHTKALLRRAKAYEMKDKLEEALKDYQEVVKLDPSIKVAVEATRTLPPKIELQREKLKQEAIGQLKNLGNSFLGMFGMSLDNFQFQQDPNTGGYSVKMKS